MDYNTSVEQKLTLIRTLRNEQEQNRNKIRMREEILYPEHTYKTSYDLDENPINTSGETQQSLHLFSLRFFICISLFLLFFFLHLQAPVPQMHFDTVRLLSDSHKIHLYKSHLQSA